MLETGLDAALAACGTDPADDAANALVDPADTMTCEYDLVMANGTFDNHEYMWHNRELHWCFCLHAEGLRHFIRYGWRHLRNPSQGFDVWWYWTTYLDPGAEVVNPYVHYLAEGRLQGHAPVPPVLPARQAPPVSGRPRRICLFAGFDGDGLVDDYVVAYVRELSRHADVFYLADCPLEDGELDKLAPYTRGRWSIRHGRYDFGSYSLLARDLVGWDTIATYDELLLTNDSSYLLRPLDEVFDTMDARPAHWWGLQATDDDFRPGDQERLGRRLRIDDLVEDNRQERPWRISDCFHIGSYFMALRSDVIADPEFRRRLDTVAAQSDKNSIIRKYEIGISSYLTLAGYQVDTFIDGVLPFHPIYRESAFDLLEEGFPFIKRQFLHENPFHVVDLHRWKDRVLAAAPDADVEAMERNLWRVSPSFNLHRALSVRRTPGQEFAQRGAHRPRQLLRPRALGAPVRPLVGVPRQPAHGSPGRSCPRGVRGGPARPHDQEGAGRADREPRYRWGQRRGRPGREPRCAVVLAQGGVTVRQRGSPGRPAPSAGGAQAPVRGRRARHVPARVRSRSATGGE